MEELLLINLTEVIMIEIFANNLGSFFENTRIKGTCIYKGKEYEVWEVDEDDFDIMCYMTEERFKAYCPDGWWRSSIGSNLGNVDGVVEINGKEMLGWFHKKDIDDEYTPSYHKLTDYLCYYIGASTPSNICACTMDLAKYNNMTLGELFNKYEE